MRFHQGKIGEMKKPNLFFLLPAFPQGRKKDSRLIHTSWDCFFWWWRMKLPHVRKRSLENVWGMLRLIHWGGAGCTINWLHLAWFPLCNFCPGKANLDAVAMHHKMQENWKGKKRHPNIKASWNDGQWCKASSMLRVFLWMLQKRLVFILQKHLKSLPENFPPKVGKCYAFKEGLNSFSCSWVFIYFSLLCASAIENDFRFKVLCQQVK